MLGSDGGQHCGLIVLGGTGLVGLLHLDGAGAGLLSGFCALRAIAAPRPTSTEHAERPGDRWQRGSCQASALRAMPKK